MFNTEKETDSKSLATVLGRQSWEGEVSGSQRRISWDHQGWGGLSQWGIFLPVVRNRWLCFSSCGVCCLPGLCIRLPSPLLFRVSVLFLVGAVSPVPSLLAKRRQVCPELRPEQTH